MHNLIAIRAGHREAAIIGTVLLLPVGCANTSKDDAANCASQGLVAGASQFNQCVTKLQQRRMALATLNKQADPVVKLNSNLDGRYSGGCSRADSRTTCNAPF